MPKHVKTSKDKKSHGGTCLTCTRRAKTCGLCDSCYQAAVRRIRLGQVTRQKLERLGLILPPRRTGRQGGAWNKKAAKLLEDK